MAAQKWIINSYINLINVTKSYQNIKILLMVRKKKESYLKEAIPDLIDTSIH